MNKFLFKTAVFLFVLSTFLIPRISSADIIYNDIEDLVIASFECIDLDENGTDDFAASEVICQLAENRVSSQAMLWNCCLTANCRSF